MPSQPAKANDPLRGMRSGKWTKHGGAVYGLVKERIKKEWNCQMCAETMPVELKPFLFELYSGDYIRICNKCQHLVVKAEARKVVPTNTIIYRRIVKIVRKGRRD